MNELLKLACHCGAISLRLSKPVTEMTECNCSVCDRYAALWAYFLPEDVEIQSTGAGTRSYQRGDRQIDFHHCRRCGCVTHYVSNQTCPIDRVAVNLRLAKASQRADIKLRRFDGADTFREIT